jgi:hypothetical protein
MNSLINLLKFAIDLEYKSEPDAYKMKYLRVSLKEFF